MTQLGNKISRVDAILAGRVTEFGPNGEPSAFRKTLVMEPVYVSRLGLEGDEQADRRYHGGPEKALLQYNHDHYAAWCRDHPQLSTHLSKPGAFGENLSSSGFDEHDICIGDQFRVGNVVVEVSQGRQPCWKLGHRFNDPRIVKEVIRTGRCGWYCRIVKPGEVGVGDPIVLLERPNPEWSVARVFQQLIAGQRDLRALQTLSTLSKLSDSWQSRAAKLYEKLSMNSDT